MNSQKQIIISLLARSLYFAPLNSKVEISAYKSSHKDTGQNAITIEINDDGINVDENLLKDITRKSKSDFPSLSYILLELETIKDLVKKTLSGDLKINDFNHHGNYITILLPTQYQKSSKVIQLFKIAGR